MSVFFSSDHHFGHTAILEFADRPFNDVEHMNEMMVQYWNETVEPWDTVWYLGDFAMGAIQQNLPVAAQLNGIKILVPGNHDRCWKGGKGRPSEIHMWEDRYLDAGFQAIVHEPKPMKVGDIEIAMCHFPVVGESRYETPDRFSFYRPEDSPDMKLACGHVHQAWLQGTSPLGANEVNVGVDVWDYRPVAVEWVAEMLQ